MNSHDVARIPSDLTVKVIVGASHAYACIKTGCTSLDVQLAGGKSASKALLQAAAEARRQASLLLERGLLMEQAAAKLSQ